MNKRGRFDVVFVFKSGGWIRYTSNPTRSLFAAEVVDQLREFCRYIDKGLAAERRTAKGQKKAKP